MMIMRKYHPKIITLTLNTKVIRVKTANKMIIIRVSLKSGISMRSLIDKNFNPITTSHNINKKSKRCTNPVIDHQIHQIAIMMEMIIVVAMLIIVVAMIMMTMMGLKKKRQLRK